MWLGREGGKETGTSSAGPGQASTVVGPQPACVPVGKGSNAVPRTDCSVAALVLVSSLYRLGRRGLEG